MGNIVKKLQVILLKHEESGLWNLVRHSCLLFVRACSVIKATCAPASTTAHQEWVCDEV